MEYKSNIGLVKTVGLTTSLKNKSADKDIKVIKKLLKQLDLEENTDNSSFGIRLLEWDAEDTLSTWKEMQYKIEKVLPNATTELFEGVSEEESDDYTYEYEHLEITI